MPLINEMIPLLIRLMPLLNRLLPLIYRKMEFISNSVRNELSVNIETPAYSSFSEISILEVDAKIRQLSQHHFFILKVVILSAPEATLQSCW